MNVYMFLQVFLVCFDRLWFSRFTCVKSNRLSPHRLIMASLLEAVKVYFPCSVSDIIHREQFVLLGRGGRISTAFSEVIV